MKMRERRVEKRVKRVLEQKKIVGQEKKLWMSFTRLAVRLASNKDKFLFRRGKKRKNSCYYVSKHSNMKNKERPIPSVRLPGRLRSEEKYYQVREHAVVNFCFARVVLLLLGLKGEKKPPAGTIGAKPMGGRISLAESTPWLLASIIYHLTILREGGAKNNVKFQISNVKSKKKIRRRGKPVLFHFPSRAVIFAYGS